MKLAGRTAVVTGAGSGIGRALAVSLAGRHCHLALADIDDAALSQTGVLVENRAVKVSLHHLDVADPHAVAALPKAVAQRHPQVDLLFNNAGVALGGSFEEISEADFQWLFDINFWGVVRMSRAFLPVLRQSDAARIVNISSLFGLISPPGQAAYSASKFAVRGFSNALRYELEGFDGGGDRRPPGRRGDLHREECAQDPRANPRKRSHRPLLEWRDCCACRRTTPLKSSSREWQKAKRVFWSAWMRSSPRSSRD